MRRDREVEESIWHPEQIRADLKAGMDVGEAEVRAVLREMVNGYASLRATAARWRVSPAYLSNVLRGRQAPGKKLLRVMGLERVEHPPTYQVQGNGRPRELRDA